MPFSVGFVHAGDGNEAREGCEGCNGIDCCFDGDQICEQASEKCADPSHDCESCVSPQSVDAD